MCALDQTHRLYSYTPWALRESEDLPVEVAVTFAPELNTEPGHQQNRFASNHDLNVL